MNSKSIVKSDSGRTAISRFFLALASIWSVFWVVYIIAHFPSIMYTKSVAFDPADITAGQQSLLDAGNAIGYAVRWLLPLSLPVVWLFFGRGSTDKAEERALLRRAGLVSLVTAAVMLAAHLISRLLLGIETDKQWLFSLVIRIYVVFSCLPVLAMLYIFGSFVRRAGKQLKSARLHRVGKGFVATAVVGAAVNIVSISVTTIVRGLSATWVNIDWLIVLPMGIAVMFEAARYSARFGEIKL